MRERYVLLRMYNNVVILFSLPLSAFSFFPEEKPVVGQTLVLSAHWRDFTYLSGTYRITEVVQGKGQNLVPDLPPELCTINEEIVGYGVRIEKISDEIIKNKVLQANVEYAPC